MATVFVSCETKNINVAGWSVAHAERHPDRPGVIDRGAVWSNAALHDRAKRLATALSRLGLEPGEPVALILDTSVELFVAADAVWCAGGAVAVLPAHSGGQTLHALRDAGIGLVITSHRIDAARAPAVRHWVGVGLAGAGAAGSPDMLDMEELIEACPPMPEPIFRSPSDLAQLCYTGGATGRPKAVMYSHGALDAYYQYRLREMGANDRRTVLFALPPSAFGARFVGLRAVSDTTYVLLKDFTATAALEHIERHRVTVLPLVPTMAEQLAAHSPDRRYDCSSLRTISLSGSHVGKGLIRRLRSSLQAAAGGELAVQVGIHYGMTEVGGGIAFTMSGGDGVIGPPMPGISVRIEKADGTPAGVGEVGEIVVRTPYSGSGYWNDPEETRAVFRDGHVRTGDLGQFDQDGNLRIVGRIKDVIIQGGYNVHPREVADAILAVPGVRDCAVVGVPNALLGEEVVACVVRADPRVGEEEIRASCRAALDERKQPASVLFFESLPRTGALKLDAQELRRQVATRLAACAPPRGEPMVSSTDQRLRTDAARSLVRRVLDNVLAADGRADRDRSVEGDSSFSDLGIDSIGAVRFAHALGREVGFEISPTQIYATPTVPSLAGWIAGRWSPSSAQPSATGPATRIVADDPVVIVGMACRLPGGSTDPERFWDFLVREDDAVGPLPELRRTGSRVPQGCFLDRIEEFDGAFFRLAGEAAEIDPQHRMLLEAAWEALEDSGCLPSKNRQRKVGVFLGIYGHRYKGGSRLGALPSMAAARICHFFDFHGPAVAIDTTCSSSLVALHGAMSSLRSGECDVALVGGVNISVDTDGDGDLGVAAADGRCKAFAANADGFGRGEGCVMVVLKRHSTALADNDRVRATLLGSAVNHDGRSSSLTAPNEDAQVDVIGLALRSAGVAPEMVQYVEAHGTGTILGDPIEVAALERVFGARAGAPLRIGSVKTNVGHLEAAAGLVGLLKVVLSIEKGRLPASLHYTVPNPHIPWSRIAIRVQDELSEWPRPDRPLVAGVSSFGMSGTNAHVIVGEPPAEDRGRADADIGPHRESCEYPLPLSAQTPAALQALAERYVDFLTDDRNRCSLRDVSYTASCRRAPLKYRLAVSGRSLREVADALRDALERCRRNPPSAARCASVTFVFPDSGSLRAADNLALYESEPGFKAALDDCARHIERHVPWRLIDELAAHARRSEEARTALAEPMTFATQMALYRVWRSAGVSPAMVLGYGCGEIAAACAAGALSLARGAWLSCERGRAIAHSAEGRLAILELPVSEVRRLVAELGVNVDVAAEHAPDETIVGGSPDGVGRILGAASARGIRARQLPARRAAHSRLLAEPAERLLAAAGLDRAGAADVVLISTLTGGKVRRTDAAHWVEQLRRPVRFCDAVRTAIGEGADAFVEIAPRPALAAAIETTIRASGATRHIPVCTGRPAGADERSVESELLQSLCALYCCGYDVDWSGRFPAGARLVGLPRYAWQRAPYWQSAVSEAAAAPAQRPEREQPESTPGGPGRAELGAAPGHSRPFQVIDGTAGAALEEELAALLGLPQADLPLDVPLQSLGVDSLGVARLRARLARRGAAPMPAGLLQPEATVAELLAAAGRRSAPGEEAPAAAGRVSWLRADGAEPTFVWIHPAGGGVSCYEHVAAALPFRAAAIRMNPPQNGEDPNPSIDDLARQYVDLLQASGIDAPLVLAGWSFGGTVAYQMAAHLAASGRLTRHVILIDTFVPAADPQHPDHSLVRLKARREAVAAHLRELYAEAAGGGPAEIAEVIEKLVAGDPLADIAKLVAAISASALPKRLLSSDLITMLQVLRSNLDRHEKHDLPPFAGSVLSLRAAATPAQHDERLARRAPHLRVEALAGDHYSVMAPGAVAPLAAAVMKHLAGELGYASRTG